MSPYFESIRIHNRQIQHLPYHNQRLNRTRKALFGSVTNIDLFQHIHMPPYIDDAVWKCRVTYDSALLDITFEKYQGRQFNSFKLIEVPDTLSYQHKGDRSELLSYYNRKGHYDDIVMVKSGYLTDSYWSNLIFFQSGRWYTPNTPLLHGTMRAYLLDHGILTERAIRVADIPKYSFVMPINALNPFDLSQAISTTQIKE